MPVKKGDKISVEYTGTFDDGTVFDSSVGKQPLEFEVGSGQLIKGFDTAVIGMSQGQEKTIKLKPEEAYGNIIDSLIRSFPRSQFPKEPEAKPGMMLMVGTPDGRKFPAMIKEVGGEEIKIDMNHPLAGKTLNFKIKVVKC